MGVLFGQPVVSANVAVGLDDEEVVLLVLVLAPQAERARQRARTSEIIRINE